MYKGIYVLHVFENYLLLYFNYSIICNIFRWNGIAKGVGTQRIIGRIHMVQLQIENNYLASSFTVLDQQPMDVLLGLDMLKRHQVNSNSTFLFKFMYLK